MTCRDVGPSSEPLPDGGIRILREGNRYPQTSLYLGETGFSAFHRGLAHQRGMRLPNTNQGNAFARHLLQYHQGDDDEMKVQVDVVKNFDRSMQRQVWEGVEIREVSCDILMNSKQDHYAPAVGHMEVRRDVVDRVRV